MPPLSISGRYTAVETPAAAAVAAETVQARKQDLRTGQKFRLVTIMTIAFVILSNIKVYTVMNHIITFFKWEPIITETGPTVIGILIHACIFFILGIYLVYT